MRARMPTSFVWLSTSEDVVRVVRHKSGDFCGYLERDYDTPGTLHMQFLCPDCEIRQDLAVTPIGLGKSQFRVSGEEYYDMSKPVVTNTLGPVYNHRIHAVSRVLFENTQRQGMKDTPFSFIHKCTECESRFRTLVHWSEKYKAFAIRLFRPKKSELSQYQDIGLVQTWDFVNSPYFQI